jgi:murein DD-endopeptidase MepM/ murein hydrolase activator NlpD
MARNLRRGLPVAALAVAAVLAVPGEPLRPTEPTQTVEQDRPAVSGRATPEQSDPDTTAVSGRVTPDVRDRVTPAVTPRVERRVRYAFPVTGRVSYGRSHALYPATDIFAPCGRRVLSPVDGTLLEVNRVDRFVKARPKGAWRGGRFISIRGDDGVRHYGSHLRAIVRGLKPGVRVKAGQFLGRVGHTGNANGICHLHYALSPVCAKTGDWWVRRGVVYPWRYLDAWRNGRWASPRAAVVRWQRRHGCPAHP